MCSARLCAGQKVLPEMRQCLGTPVRLTAKHSSVHPCKSFAPAALQMTNACAATAPVHIKQTKCLLCIVRHQGIMHICTMHAVMSEVEQSAQPDSHKYCVQCKQPDPCLLLIPQH